MIEYLVSEITHFFKQYIFEGPCDPPSSFNFQTETLAGAGRSQYRIMTRKKNRSIRSNTAADFALHAVKNTLAVGKGGGGGAVTKA